MDPQEKEEVVAALQEELRGFFAWIIEEVGTDYYVEDPDRANESLDEEAQKRFQGRVHAKRLDLWERDWYAFSNLPEHPSIYGLLEAEDLEIVHYLEDLPCEHYRLFDNLNEEGEAVPEKKFDQSFGIVLASQTLGWMYRLDLCELCGLVEIWSMAYSPEEIAFYMDHKE